LSIAKWPKFKQTDRFIINCGRYELHARSANKAVSHVIFTPDN